MKIAVLSNNSYLQQDSRLGLQLIAEKLSERGHTVDYFAVPTYPFDFLSPSRRKMFFQAWQPNGSATPHRIQKNLNEYSLRTCFPRKRCYWKFKSQIKYYTSLFPNKLKKEHYDVCICDTAITFLYHNRIQAKKTILRLNDNPDGFTHFLHPMVVESLKDSIRQNHFDAIWPVSEALETWAKELNNKTPTHLFPNGVDLAAFQQNRSTERRPKTATYIGRFNTWFDLELVIQTAKLIPDWTFDLYGTPPKKLPNTLPSNLSFQGHISFDTVPSVLSQYTVGLIPFTGNNTLLNAIDPLKFLQYLAAGLHVVSTDVGRLKEAFGEHASFANTPEDFAQAIQACQGNPKPAQALLEARSWDKIVSAMEIELGRT